MTALHAHPRLRRWLHEPLLHFVIGGALMFAAYGWLNRDLPTASAHQIVLTQDDLLQMRLAWRAQGRAEPTSKQLQTMIETKVREEVLSREALSMGLGNDDVIIKRRLGQKMDFLAEDLSALREPTREELQAWLRAHPQDFTLPPRASFHHLYFSFDKHQDRDRAWKAAAAALTRIDARPANAVELGAIGDAFMFQDNYAERTPDQTASVFGGPFTLALFKLKPGAWSGPIESAFGWHLVYVDALTPGRLPEFEEIDTEVKAAWTSNQREQLKRDAYDVMRAKYQVVLPANEAGAAPQTGKP
ncbi:MAG: peptidylprolyl isomerase [Casimicrobiaceae bacterium]